MRLAWMALAAALAWAGTEDTFLLRNVTVHPVTSPEVANASLLVRDGVIVEIGTAKTKTPKGMRIIDGGGGHVYPGMIDSATTLGLTEIGSVKETSDIAEIGDYQPQLRAVVAVNPASEHLPVARANGITSAMTLPGGGVIAGQAAFIQLDGWTWEEMTVRAPAAMVLRFPVLSLAAPSTGAGTPRRLTYKEAKARHDEAIGKLATFFEDARRYERAKTAASPDFALDRRMEAMLPVIAGKLPVMVHAAREREIREALEFARREKIRIILAEPREFGDTLAEIKQLAIPVILGSAYRLPLEEDAAYDSQYSLAAELHRRGILFAFGSFDSSDVRNLPYQAAVTVAFGLAREEALRAVTINAAKIWGVAETVGSIEAGKRADLIVTDGDPLETRTTVKHLFIGGRAVSLETRHTRLYEKYMSRP